MARTASARTTSGAAFCGLVVGFMACSTFRVSAFLRNCNAYAHHPGMDGHDPSLWGTSDSRRATTRSVGRRRVIATDTLAGQVGYGGQAREGPGPPEFGVRSLDVARAEQVHNREIRVSDAKCTAQSMRVIQFITSRQVFVDGPFANLGDFYSAQMLPRALTEGRDR